jgi:PAS domain S-box-containing protein
MTSGFKLEVGDSSARRDRRAGRGRPAPAEPALERLARLAARLLDGRAALIEVVTPRATGSPRRRIGAFGERGAILGGPMAAAVIETGTSILIEDNSREVRLPLDPDAVAQAGAPVLDPEGAVVGAVVVIDGTAREWDASAETMVGDVAALVAAELAREQMAAAGRRSEILLREVEAQLHGVVQHASDGIWFLDPKGRILFVNERMGTLLGGSVLGMIGRPVVDFCGPDEVDSIRPLLLAGLQGAGRRFDGRLRRRDGSSIVVRATSAPTRDQDGRVTGVLGLFREIRPEPPARAAAEASGFAAVIRSARFGVAVVDGDLRIRAVNQRLIEMAAAGAGDWSVESAWGRHWSDLDSALAVETMPRIRTALQTGDSIVDEPFVTDGDRHWLLTCRASELEPGIFGVAVVIEDVTERKRALAHAAERERRLHLAMGAGRMFAFEYLPESGAVSRSANGAEILGLSTDAAVERVDQYFGLIHLDDRHRLLDILRSLTPVADNYHTSYRVIRPDGAVLVIEESGQASFDPAGRLTRVVGMSADVTEREQAFEAVRRTATLLDLVAASTPGPVYVKDREGRLLLANPAAASLGDTILATERQVMASGRAEVFEETIPLADGVHTFLSTKSPYRDESGEIIGVIGIGTDITERKRHEAAERELDRRKDELLAMLGHELRNPLAPIRNSVEILRRLDPGESRLSRPRDVIERQVDHLSRLVNDLLEVSRLNHGRVRIERQPVEVAAVVDRAVEASRPELDARRHELIVALPEQPLRVEADPVRLAQAISNLLGNAGKFTEPGGRIELEVARVDSEVEIRVRDNGVGMAPELLARIFDVFTQAESAADRSRGGLGLGLPLVKGLIELHGGTVTARSDGPDRGSEFAIRLPLSSDDRGAAADRTERRAMTNDRYRILVVDDSTDGRESMAELLRLAGHDVSEAADGPAALRVAQEFRPHVVLLDIGLPGMDGFEVATRLRQMPETQNAVLVALTGYGQPEIVNRSKQVGFNHHLVKPMHPNALEELLPPLG